MKIKGNTPASKKGYRNGDKKKAEFDILNRAIGQLLMQSRESKMIGKLLCGDDIPRKEDERPDFLRFVPSVSKDGAGTVVGIEHFQVDHLSEVIRKDDAHRVRSLGRPYQKDTHNLYERFHEQVTERDEITDELPEAMCSIFEKHLPSIDKATFPLYLRSFKQGMEKHLKQVEIYEKAIQSEAQMRNCDHKLIFLIEVHTDFHNLFLHYNGKTQCENQQSFLFYEPIVQLLETAAGLVDYIILYCSSALFVNPKTYAFSTRNIRGYLRKRNIPVYQYCGHDLFLKPEEYPFLSTQHHVGFEMDDEKVTFLFQSQVQHIIPEREVLCIRAACQFARQYEQQRIPFVVDAVVEDVLKELRIM